MYCVHCGAPRTGGDPTCGFCQTVFEQKVDAPLTSDHGMPRAVVDELRSGNKIQAIKLYREATGCGLKAAKEAIEAIEHKFRG